MNDVGRNEFEALVQKTKRISLGSPTYPVSVGIKWADAELKRLREENERLKVYETWRESCIHFGMNHPPATFCDCAYCKPIREISRRRAGG